MGTTLTTPTIYLPAVNDAADADDWGNDLNLALTTLHTEITTATQNKSFADKVVSRANFKDIEETVNAIGNTGGAWTVDYTNGSVQTATLTSNATSLTISNAPAAGGFMTLIITQDGTGSRTLDLTGGTYKQAGGGSLVLSTAAAAVDILYMSTPDGGTTWYVSLNKSMSAIT